MDPQIRAAAALSACLLLGSCATAGRPALELAEAVDQEVAYVCPMHADYTSDKPGNCEKCGMALVLGTPFDMRDFRLEVKSTPELPKAGEKVSLDFQVVHPSTGEPVTDFELVHEMPYHLFVISQDMEYFQHIHPAEGQNGHWSIDVVLPKPGFYALVSDFAPKGASSQMTMRPLVTADADEDPLDQGAHLVADTTRTSVVDDLAAEVSFDPPTLVAGQHGHLVFKLTDPASHLPVNQIQTYLGAFGHMFIMDENMSDYVHSHPVDTPSPQLNLDEIRGGPEVMFEGMMPKPGRYRAWAQFKYRDKIHTFVTTFDVAEVGQSFSR